MRFFYIILFFSTLFSQDGLLINDFHIEFRKHFDKGTLDEVLNSAQEKLNNKDLCPKDSYNELYLKLWEIKGYFYIGEIEKSIEKKEELRLKIEKDNYKSKIFGEPFFSYLDSTDKQQSTCIVKTFLSRSNTLFWNLEVLSDELFYEHFSDLHLMVGVNIDDEYNITSELHDQATRVINKDGTDVTYSIFPPLVSFDKNNKLDQFDLDLIIAYEFKIAKEARIKLLQEQKQTAVEFKNLLKGNKSKGGTKTYSCKIIGLPLVKSNSMPFYMLYIHDSQSVDRYSFRMKRSRTNSADIILLHWKNKKWDMQKLFDKSKIEISIPELFTKAFGDMEPAFRISSIGNPVSLSKNRERGITVKNSDNQTENLSKDWNFQEEEDYNLKNYEPITDEAGNKLIKVERVEIDLKEVHKEINIEVADTYMNAQEEKKLRGWRIAFYGSIILSLALLFY